MKIAVAQLSSSPRKEENVQRMAEMVSEAAVAGAELVVFPEASMSIHDTITDIPPDGETLNGPHVQALKGLARVNGIGVIAGVWEISPEPARVYNTTIHISAVGELNAIYRKIHLYDAFGAKESDVVVPAEPSATVIPFGDLTLGLACCYDLRFPEMSRFLLDAGANLFVIPAGWMPGPRKKDHWATLLRARAIENTAFVIGVNQAGPKFDGGSMVVDPDGNILAQLDEREQIVLVDIDPGVVGDVRARNPSIINRRFAVQNVN